MSPRDANLKIDLAGQTAKQQKAVDAINEEISKGQQHQQQQESVSPNRLS